MTNTNVDYINTFDYTKLSRKIKDLVTVMEELSEKNTISRNLRYVEVDTEGERARGKLQPDELLIPQHIIDTNIRREQSSYIQYITQSPRAVVMLNLDNPAADVSAIERDVTNKIRFPGWQMSMFANVDGFQQNGYGIMELVMDQSQPGELAHEFVSLGDLGIVTDTKDLQETEMLARNYYFSRTRLLAMCSDATWGFDAAQVAKVVEQEPRSDGDMVSSNKEKSLFKIQKVMFRVGGVVHVAWSCNVASDDWLRAPRPLFIGRRKAKTQPSQQDMMMAQVSGLPPSEEVYETKYPYFVFPYLISENNTISQLKGRAFLDQDCQQAVSSLLSSYCTAHRRASGLYFSKDVSDPNDDLLLQKNVFFKPGTLINSKITQFQLQPPSADVVNAINSLVTSNQQETSQVNFAAQNRKDSRKTATEISAATQASQALSTVQVVLFSNALKNMYTTMFEVVRSRVMVGLIKVTPDLLPMYTANYLVKPAGDTDVIERQQLVQSMMTAWPVLQNTPVAVDFLCDMVAKMFPEYSAKYIQILQQARAQSQSAQAQQMQQAAGAAQQMAMKIVELSKHSEFFSDIGKIHALPAIEQAAAQITQMGAKAQ